MTAKDKIASLEKQVAVLRRENDHFREQLHKARLTDARAQYEIVLERKDGWRRSIAAVPERPNPVGFFMGGRMFRRTDEFDPFGRSVYRES